MKRKIKFRAWSPERNGFVVDCYPIGIGTSEGFELCGVGEGDDCPDTEDDGLVLQQFTGLCDVFGKDIYEGDILQGKYNKWEVIGMGWSSEDQYGLIIQRIGSTKKSMADNSFQRASEVIGNIFQNEELLNEKI